MANAVVTHDRNGHASDPAWVPRRGMRIRWDRSLPVGDAVFRWHSRLDGSALLYGPSGKLAIGDTVALPAGFMHGKGAVPRVPYVVTEQHDAGEGHVWIRAVRKTGG